MTVVKSQQAGRPLLALCAGMLISLGCCSAPAFGASCLTQAQMSPADRDALVARARTIMTAVQAGNVDTVKTDTLPAVAADFSGIANSVQALAPLIQNAAITVDALYDLDASTDQAGEQATTFYCGSPVVVLNFTSLPPAHYALAVLHATGVAKPQQAAFILAQDPDKRWMLAGFFVKPMLEADHDGLWYWASARKYAQSSGKWSAWFYYRIAANLLDPLDNLSSPNLTRLMNEQQAVKPANLPEGNQPVALSFNGASFQLSTVDITTEFGALDLDVHYLPDPMQSAQLRNPLDARKQVVAIMSGLLAQHPELRSAFHGMWVHADQGSESLFALELPMDQISGPAPAASLNPPAQ